MLESGPGLGNVGVLNGGASYGKLQQLIRPQTVTLWSALAGSFQPYGLVGAHCLACRDLGKMPPSPLNSHLVNGYWLAFSTSPLAIHNGDILGDASSKGLDCSTAAYLF